MFDKDCEWN